MINDEFLEAATGLGLSSAPTIFFDSASNLFVLSAPSVLYYSSLDKYYEIYMNKAPYQLFSSFPAVNVSHSSEYGLNFRLLSKALQRITQRTRKALWFMVNTQLYICGIV